MDEAQHICEIIRSENTQAIALQIVTRRKADHFGDISSGFDIHNIE
jgi:hypothetical protein